GGCEGGSLGALCRRLRGVLASCRSARVGESRLCQGPPPPKFDQRLPGSAWSPPATRRSCRLRSERRGREVQRASDSREEELTQIRRRTRSPPPGAQSILASVPFATRSQHEGGLHAAIDAAFGYGNRARRRAPSGCRRRVRRSAI